MIRVPIVVLVAGLAFGPLSGQAQTPAGKRIQVRCHVFQVTRDAPVVPGRATTVRVYADWTEETEPFEDEQLAFHDATVRIRAGGADLSDMEHTYWRPDWHVKSDSVSATLSANHNGWSPAPGNGRSPVVVRAVVEFKSTETEKTFQYDAGCPVVATPSAPTLTVDYYFIKTMEWWHEDWSDPSWQADRDAYTGAGLPWPGEWGLIEERGHRLMREGIDFAGRVFPVGGFELRYGGILGYNRWIGDEHAGEVASVLWDRATAARPDADIIVGLVPPSIADGWLGKMMTFLESEDPHHSHFLGGKRLVLVELDPHTGGNVTTVAHEFGHFYGLCHAYPSGDVWTPERPEEQNNCVLGDRLHIEGFRPSTGVNKSETEGNGVVPDDVGMVVAPVMDGSGDGNVPQGTPMEWMPNEQYERLVQSFELLGLFEAGVAPDGSPEPNPEAGPAGFGGPSPEMAPPPRTSPTAAPPPPAQERHFFVSGVVSASGNAARLHPLQILDPSGTPPAQVGDHRVEVLDAGGAVLAEAPFAALLARSPHGASSADRLFGVAVPYRSEAAQIVVRRGETVLARRTRSESAPHVTIDSPPPGEAWDGSTPIRWSGTDPDGDTLAYDVLYSSGSGPWTTLATGVLDTELRGVGPDDLEPGPDARLRVVAMDGFHATVAEAGFEPVGGFRLLATTPGPGDTVATSAGTVTFHFNRQVDPSTVRPEAFRLVGDGGSVVEARVSLDASGRSVTLELAGALTAGATYEASVAGDIADASGARLESIPPWAFHTAPDIRRPRLAGMRPMAGALGVNPQAPIDLRFDEPVDPATLTTETVLIELEDGASVAGSWSWDPDRSTATFRPAIPWTSNATYRVTVTEGVRDPSGNAARARAPWTFTVAGSVGPGGSQ